MHLIGPILVLFACPLVFTDTVAQEYVIPRLVLILVGMLLWAESAVLRKTKADYLILIALAVAAFFCWFSEDPIISFLGRRNDYAHGFLALVLYACAFKLGASMNPRLLQLSVFSAVIVSAYAILQRFGVELFTLPGVLPPGRAVSTLGSPVHLGTFLAMNIPLAHWSVSPILFAGVVASGSRGPLLAVFLSFVFMFILKKSRKLALCFLLVATSATIWGVSVSKKAGDIGRMAAWSVAMEQDWGTGLDTFGLTFRKHKPDSFVAVRSPRLRHEHAHNDILQVLSSGGVFLFLPYIFLWILIWREIPGRSVRILSSLAVFFFLLKFNPGSLTVYVLGAVLAGVILSTSRKTRICARPAIVFCLLLVVPLAASDYVFKSASRFSGWSALEKFEMANRIAPWETQYSAVLINAYKEAGRSGMMDWREVLNRSQVVTQRLISLRPNSPDSYLQAGFIGLMGSQLGLPMIHEAEENLRKAGELDPKFPDIQHRLNELKTLRRKKEQNP